MTEFEAYLKVGFDHIVAKDGLDHILFIVALSAVYQFKDWRRILILVTAFTLGHSFTLVLAALNIVGFNRALVEFLIPITIILTCVFNLWERGEGDYALQGKALFMRYGMAIIFGFIHGFAFSNYLRQMFALSKESIVMKLLAFNIGIELGQIVVVLVVLAISTILVELFKLRRTYWRYTLSTVALVMSVWLLVDKF
jgi:hypothetical protein